MTDYAYFFISRLKKNAVIREVESIPLSKDSAVLSDKMVYIGCTQNRTENVFRPLEVDTSGNALLLITFFLHTLIKPEIKSKKPLLRIMRLLEAAFWKTSYIY
nr:hypothetical protein [Bacillus mycoides]